MQTTKVTILQIVSSGDGANAGTTEHDGLVPQPSAIGTTKRKESRLPATARFNRSSARSRIDQFHRKSSGPGFNAGKSRRLVRRWKPRRFRSIFYRKNGLLPK